MADSIAIGATRGTSRAAQAGRRRDWPGGPTLSVHHPYGARRRRHFQRPVHGFQRRRLAHPGLDHRHRRLPAHGAVLEGSGGQGPQRGRLLRDPLRGARPFRRLHDQLAVVPVRATRASGAVACCSARCCPISSSHTPASSSRGGWWRIVMIGILTYTSYVGIKQSSKTTVIMGSLEIGILLLLALVWIVKAGPNQPRHLVHAGFVAARLGRRLLRHGVRHPELPRFRGGRPAGRGEQERQALADHLDHRLDHRHRPVLLLPGLCVGRRLGRLRRPAGLRRRFQRRRRIRTSPWAQNALGIVGALLVLFVIANSSFACSVAGQNAVTRVYYSLGRAGVFPKWLFHINATTQTPDRAIFFQAGISLVFALDRAASVRTVRRLRSAGAAVHRRA